MGRKKRIESFDGVYEKDFSQILGLTLSLFSERLITRSYLGREFKARSLLLDQFKELKETQTVNSNENIQKSVLHLEKGMSSLLNLGNEDGTGVDLELHSHFASASEFADESMANSISYREENVMEAFDAFLLTIKLQIICCFYEQLVLSYKLIKKKKEMDSKKKKKKKKKKKTKKGKADEDQEREDAEATSEVPEHNPRKIVESLMISPFVQDAAGHLVKPVSPKTRKLHRVFSRPAEQIERITETPGIVSYVLTKALAVDRICYSYEKGAIAPAPYSRIFNIQNNISIFQQKLTEEVTNVRSILASDMSQSMVMTTQESKKINVFSQGSSNIRGSIDLHTSKVINVVTNKDWILVCCSHGGAIVYDTHDFKEQNRLETPAIITALAINSEKNRLYCADDIGNFKTWSLPELKMVCDFKDFTRSLTVTKCLTTDEGIHPNTTKLLLSGHINGSIFGWNILGKQTSMMFIIPRCHEGVVTSISCRSAEIYSAGEDNRIHVWDIATQSCTSTIEHGAEIDDMVADLDVVFTTSNGFIRAYDRYTTEKVFEIKSPEALNKLTISDDRFLFSFGESIRKWHIDSLLDTMKLKKRVFGSIIESRKNIEFYSPAKKRGTWEANNTMLDIVNNPRIRGLFLQFLRDNCAEENLLFWIAVQRFRDFCDNGTPKTALSQLFEDIVEEYIDDDGPQCVNIKSKHREDLFDALKHGKVSREVFQDAEKEVLILLGSNFLLRFLDRHKNEFDL